MLSLLTVPDERLRQKCALVKSIDGYILNLAKEMLAYMDTPIDGRKTLGFAAPQFGEMIRLIAIRLQGLEIVLANPEVVRAVNSYRAVEGCRSLPGKLYYVQRPKIIEVKGMALDGSIKVVKGRDLLASALAHETDHCDGIMIDKAGRLLSEGERRRFNQ